MEGRGRPRKVLTQHSGSKKVVNGKGNNGGKWVKLRDLTYQLRGSRRNRWRRRKSYHWSVLWVWEAYVEISGGKSWISELSQLMHLEAEAIARKEVFFVTFIYAFNEKARRETLWKDMMTLARGIKSPRLVLGGFNDILSLEERVRDRVRRTRLTTFKECI
uniref:Uncharacterized protein n=1 Tax=Cannabis sativa TaxID=3483 RepID=A0A803Q975_CANSA